MKREINKVEMVEKRNEMNEKEKKYNNLRCRNEEINIKNKNQK
jgi:hypothetical protein